MWKWLRLFLPALLLIGCAGAPSTPSPPAPGGAKPLKAILVLNGTLGDKSFFDSAQRGMDRARQELGVATETIELGWDPAKHRPGLEDVAANKDYDILIVGTFQMAEILADVAAKHPDKKFIIFDTAVDYEKCPNRCSNVYSILYKQNEGSYLAGLYAGLMARRLLPEGSGRPMIGVVGGMDIPVINDFIVGYKQGAKEAGLDPDRDVLVQYAGAFNDPAKGKEIAKAMYRQGAVIVFNVAGGTGLGVLEAAAEEGRWSIGVDSDQWFMLKDQKPEVAARILTSMLKNVDNSIYRALRLALEGKVPWGQAEALGIAEGGVGLAKNENYEKLTPEDVKARIEEAEKAILEGRIRVDTVFK